MKLLIDNLKENNPDKCLSTTEIENYVNNSLNYKEQHLLELHLTQCSFCTKAIQGYQNKLQSQKQQGLKRKKNSFTFRKTFAYAASVLILISVLFYYSNNDSNRIYNQFYVSYPIEKPLNLRNKSSLDSIDNNIQFSSFYNSYYNHNYNLALQDLNKINDPSKLEKLSFYKGITHLQLEQYSEAIGYFSQVHENNNNFNRSAKWYSALAYIKLNQEKLALPKIQFLINNKGQYSNQAAQLFKHLQ